MNFDKAYEQWGQHNEKLFINTRKKFQRVWWLIPTNKPCSYYTLTVLARALQQANAEHDDKVSAASVMVHVLQYAHEQEPELNPEPTFTHTDILNYEGLHPSPMIQAIDEHHQHEAPSDKAVVQLAPETLKPIKTWPTAHAAAKALGIQNIQRAIDRHGMSGGFFWCRPGDEKNFKPSKPRVESKDLTANRKIAEDQKEAEPAVEDIRKDPTLMSATDEDIVEEIRRRRWKGQLTIPKHVEL